MAHLVPLDFWVDARQECDAVKPLYWLAECDEPTYLNVFDTSYAWNWMHETEKLVKDESNVSNIYNILHNYSNQTNKATKLFFTSNHDENSWNGTEYEKYVNTAKAFAVFSFTWQGIPLIYSGQELPNKKRLQFFDKDEIGWTNDLQLQMFYKKLAALHKTNAIGMGETFILPTENNVMAYLRKYNNDVVLVMLNLSKHDRVHICVKHQWLKGMFNNVFSGMQFSFNEEASFELMKGDYLVYKSF
jgi:glycosidase